MTRFARHASVALAAATLAVTVTACNPPADKAKQEAKIEEAGKAFGPQIAGLPTEKDKVSYMIGMQMGKSLEQVKDEVDVDVISKAIKAQVAPRPIGLLLGFEATANPLIGCPSYGPLALLPLGERVARLQGPELRARLVLEHTELVAKLPDGLFRQIVGEVLD